MYILQYWDCLGQGYQWFGDGFWLWCNICSYSSWSKSHVWYCGSQSITKKSLKRVFGVSGTALKWLRSYLTDRSQFVSMGGYRSEISSVSTGVPQGSVLGPLLFNIYLSPLGQLLRSLCLHYHLYADYMQIYIHSNPHERHDIAYLSDCITEIKTWMDNNLFCLNSDKTEIMLMGSRHEISKAGHLSRLWMALFWKSRVEWGTLELFLMLICLLILLFRALLKPMFSTSEISQYCILC